MASNVTQTLAGYIAQARYEDFPEEVVHKAKQLILDNIGCAFGGYVTDNGKALISFAREMGDKAESTLIGDGSRVSCMVAAGVNAQMANILDFDDRSVTGHPGSSIVQTAISLGEWLGASGREVIEAVVMGYEAVDRIARGAPTPTKSQAEQSSAPVEHNTGRATPYAIAVSNHVFGPAVAAAKILGLDVQQVKDAIGTAGATAPTFNLRRLTDRPASPTKCGNFWNCSTGISAAFLARQGFHGPVDYLDGPKGYWALFADATDEVHFDAMIAGLGQRYCTAGVRIKPWSTCGINLRAIQLVLEIMKDNGIKPGDIQAIKVSSDKYASSFPLNGQRPVEIWDAIFSTPWGTAMAVLGYETGPDWYARERFSDPAVLDLARKVTTGILPEATVKAAVKAAGNRSPCEVELKARGKTYVRRTVSAKGDPDQPMTEAEFQAKFRSLVNRSLDKEQTEEVMGALYDLETVRNIKRLTRLFKPARVTAGAGGYRL